MNILVTGGSGFIGSAMVRVLSKDHTVFAPSHEELATSDYLRAYVIANNIQCIVHAALNSEETPYAYKENMIGVDSVLQCAHVVDKIFLFTSGIMFNSEYAKEKADSYRYYIKAKKAQHLYVEELPVDLKKKVKTLALCGVYGPGEEETRFFSGVLSAVLSGNVISVHQNRKFHYSYVDDVAKVIRDAILIQNDDGYYSYICVEGIKDSLSNFARQIRDIVGPVLPHAPSTFYLCDPKWKYPYCVEGIHTYAPAEGITPLRDGIQAMMYERLKGVSR